MLTSIVKKRRGMQGSGRKGRIRTKQPPLIPPALPPKNHTDSTKPAVPQTGFGTRLGNSFKRVSRGIGIALLVQLILLFVYFFKPSLILPDESPEFVDFLREIRDSEAARISSLAREQQLKTGYLPDPGRVRKQRSGRVRSHIAGAIQDDGIYMKAPDSKLLNSQPHQIYEAYEPELEPSIALSPLSTPQTQHRIQQEQPRNVWEGETKVHREVQMETTLQQYSTKKDKKNNDERQIRWTSEEDAAIIRHVTENGPIRWEWIRKALDTKRNIEYEQKNINVANDRNLEYFYHLTARDVRLRWERVLLPKQDPSLKLNELPKKRLAAVSNVRQWGWGESGKIRRTDDDEIDAVAKLKVLSSPKAASSETEGSDFIQSLPLSTSTLALRAAADAVTTAAQVKLNCDDLKSDSKSFSGKKSSVLGDRVVYFQHIHKSGGSQICFLAKLHNMTGGALPNCNVPGYGPFDYSRGWFGKGNYVDDPSGEAMYRRLKGIDVFQAPSLSPTSTPFTRLNWSFVMNEVVLSHAWPLNTKRYLYAIQIREPLRRMASSMRFHHHTEHDVLNWVNLIGKAKSNALSNSSSTSKEQTADSPKFEPSYGDFGTALMRGTAPYDNFLVRTLAGPDIFGKPPGSIGLGDLALAARQLERFEIVLILEQYEVHAKLQLPAVLGWHTWLAEAGIFSFQKTKNCPLCPLTRNGRVALRNLNVFEEALYDRAVARAEELSACAANNFP